MSALNRPPSRPHSTIRSSAPVAAGLFGKAARMGETMTRAQLLAGGWTVRRIAEAVHRGRLIRVRRGHYATPATDAAVQQAVRVGGRLACVSELRFRGIWVPVDPRVHVQVAPSASRLRRPAADECVIHWSALLDPGGATESHVGLVDALVCAASCLEPWLAVAAFDSAVNRGDVSAATLARSLAGAPQRVRDLARLIDPSAQSGLETIVRLLVGALGFGVRSQVRYRGIGVVDLVVEGWVVIETDGSEHHDDAIVASRDRRRDALHAAEGRTALRFRYAQVVHDLASVAEAIIGAVETHRHVTNSGVLARRARVRARALKIS